MAKAVKHDEADMIEGAALGAARGAVGGVITAGLAGAAVSAVAWVAAIAVGIALASTATALFPALATTAVGTATFGGTVSALGGLIGASSLIVGAISAYSVGTIAAAGGGLLGLVKGTSRLSRENAAFAEKTKEASASREAEMVEVHNQAMQMGFQAGIEQGRAVGQQEGAQMVVARLEEHEAHHGAEAHHAEAHAHSHHEGAHKKSFAATETQRREAAAAAVTQIG